MNSANWCFVAVSFALGLVLTLAFMIGRVKREVPVHADGDLDAKTAVIPTSALAAGAAGGAAAAGLLGGVGKDDADIEVEAPYGAGSVRLSAGAEPPSGWDVKGNEESMLYHSTESPHYGRTVAEVWFRDVETAEAAGFNRWDSGKSERGEK